MARPLRRNVRDGWYHVFHRGTERGLIFGDARDRDHFLELLAGVVEQYGVRVHAKIIRGQVSIAPSEAQEGRSLSEAIDETIRMEPIP